MSEYSSGWAGFSVFVSPLLQPSRSLSQLAASPQTSGEATSDGGTCIS